MKFILGSVLVVHFIFTYFTYSIQEATITYLRDCIKAYVRREKEIERIIEPLPDNYKLSNGYRLSCVKTTNVDNSVLCAYLKEGTSTKVP